MKHYKKYVAGAVFMLLLILSACDSPFIPKDTLADSIAPVTTGLIFLMMLIPLVAMVAFFFLIYHLANQFHKRRMAMIEKGLFVHRPPNWSNIFLALGIGAISVSPGVGLLVYLEEGLMTGIGTGLTVLSSGIALLVIRKLTGGKLFKDK
jgi:hypothetical protein